MRAPKCCRRPLWPRSSAYLRWRFKVVKNPRTRLEKRAPLADALEGAAEEGLASCSDRWRVVNDGRSAAAVRSILQLEQKGEFKR